MVIVGIDPGIANCGVAVIDYSNGRPVLLDLGLVVTVRDKKQKQSVDIVRRVYEILDSLSHIISVYNADILAVEALSSLRDNVSTSKLAVMYGGLISLSYMFSIDFMPIHSRRAKKVLVGNANAKKEQMVIAVKDLFPDADMKAQQGLLSRRKVLGSKFHHVADAVALAIAAYEEVKDGRD